MKPHSNHRLIWAIDPFNEDPKLLNAATSTARNWSSVTQGEIIPVYVLSSRQIGYGYGYEFEYDSADYIAGQASAHANRLLSSSRIPRLADLQVLSTRSLSRLHDVDALQDFSSKAGADAILVATQGRRGLKRAFLGSFAEAALLHSSVPVIAANPEAGPSSPVRNILYPTEFGRYSRQAFNRVLGLAQTLQANITLLHVLPSISNVLLLAGTPGYAPTIPYNLSQLASTQRSYAQRRFQAWSRLGPKFGVQVQFAIAEAKDGIPATIINEARKHRTQLIAMESESGQIKAALLGSVCRTVVRESPCPVWTVRGSLAFARKRKRHRTQYTVLRSSAQELRTAA